MATVPALTDRTPAQRWAEVKDEEALWGDLRPELLAAVRTILEATMEDELTALILAGRYERTRERLDHRNGIYRRVLVTELGATELDVPRRRLVPCHPSFLARAARRTSLVDGLLREAFLRGLSTRETARLAGRLTGVPLSASAISRLGRALDARVAAFHRRPIAFAARYLLCDWLWVSVRDRAGRATKRVILAVYGIDAAGRRELLDYRQATEESAAAWGILLRSLVERGLDPEGVVLVVADGAGGIAAAVAEAFPGAELQRCWTHRIRNILEALPLAERRACLRGLRSIYRARTRRAAVGAYWRWARAWRERHPRLVAGSSATSTACLACSRCPSRSGPACAQRTCSSAPSASCAAGSGRSGRSPTAAQPTGSCTAGCSASTSSWQRARSSHSHKSLDVITG